MGDEKVEHDIDSLYKKYNNLSERVASIEATKSYFKDLVERNIASNEKLSETMHEVQMSMVKMNEKMDNMKEDFQEAVQQTDSKIKSATEQTNEKIKNVNQKVEAIEEQGKFDIWGAIKKCFPWLVVLVGFGIMYASKYIKF